MLSTDKIKGIIFDYGGTIDSNGLHWAEVIWKAYETYQVAVGKEDFRNAFVYTRTHLPRYAAHQD